MILSLIIIKNALATSDFFRIIVVNYRLYPKDTIISKSVLF